jgi:hypothetical protein
MWMLEGLDVTFRNLDVATVGSAEVKYESSLCAVFISVRDNEIISNTSKSVKALDWRTHESGSWHIPSNVVSTTATLSVAVDGEMCNFDMTERAY